MWTILLILKETTTLPRVSVCLFIPPFPPLMTCSNRSPLSVQIGSDGRLSAFCVLSNFQLSIKSFGKRNTSQYAAHFGYDFVLDLSNSNCDYVVFAFSIGCSTQKCYLRFSLPRHSDENVFSCQSSFECMCHFECCLVNFNCYQMFETLTVPFSIHWRSSKCCNFFCWQLRIQQLWHHPSARYRG